MNWLKAVALSTTILGTIFVQAQPQTSASKEQPSEKAASRRHIPTSRCDAQLGKVCVLGLDRLRREEQKHVHMPIGVKQGHLVVWIANNEENFQLAKFKRVQCSDESKEINDPNDPGPFDKTFNEDRYEQVKYAKVTGKVGNCYKHMIFIEHGKEKIDPHIMIEAGP
jgi:hypothetical protein